MVDVVHEEEAYLSCLSSDYDEHADLSMDAEDLADTDSEGSVQHLGIEPYQYEPYLSDTRSGEDGGSEGDCRRSDDDDEGSERLGNDEWLVGRELVFTARYAYTFHLIACLQASSMNTYRCSCGVKCIAMLTARESVCCLEITEIEDRMSELKTLDPNHEATCITECPVFFLVCVWTCGYCR